MPLLLAAPLLSFALAATPVAPPPHLDASWEHGWDCVACEANSMLVGNFGVGSQFKLDDPWWTKAGLLQNLGAES